MSDIDGVRKIEYVLMDAVGRRTSMCCIQWKDDEFVDVMPRMSDPIRAVGNEKRLPTLPTKAAVMRSSLYCTEQSDKEEDEATKSKAVCLVTFLTTMWSSVVVAQAAAHRLIARNPLRLAMVRSGDWRSVKQVHMTWTEDTNDDSGQAVSSARHH